CFSGMFSGREFFQELKFVPARIAVTAVLRELITVGAAIDLARGLPVVHVNFLGYDEQAHRRGPRSYFAHWSLKGIDRSIRLLWNEQHKRDRRNYTVWIYSAHGQEETIPFGERSSKSLHEIVEGIVQSTLHSASSATETVAEGTEYHR